MTNSKKSSAEARFERVALDALVPYARNARTHSPEQVAQIAASIREFGFISPVIVDADNGIIAGHGRVLAAQKLKLTQVPCVRVEHLSETQKRAYILADNKLAMNAGWDDDLLKVELATLQEENFDALLTGFSAEEMKALLGETAEPEPQGDPDDCPEVEQEKPAVTVRGMTWILGSHRLRCGDSTSAEDVALLMVGEKADMVFTDPPYGMRLDTNFQRRDRPEGNSYRAVAGDHDDFDPRFIIESFKNSKQMFIFGADYFHDLLPKNGSFVVWDKRNDALEKAVGNDFELCWSREHHKRLVFRKLWSGITAKEKNELRCHPTQKPIALAEWFFERWGKDCQTVLDLFGGSGSTLIACEKTNRRCFMMELDEHYCDVIVKRWQKYTSKQATLEGDGRTFDELAAIQEAACAR